MMFVILKLFLIFGAARASWPDTPWLNEQPLPSASAYAVAFGSPLDVQFLKVLDVWKIFQKKYEPLGINFVAIAKPENGFPFSDPIVNSIIKDGGYTFPVFLDLNGSYSRQWRAYVTPTVIIVLKDQKVMNFDPGNFDPSTYEKGLQKVVKETGISKVPTKEFSTEISHQNCPTSQTYFLGSKQASAWTRDPVTWDQKWTQKENFIFNSDGDSATITVQTRLGFSVIADADGGSGPLKIVVDSQKLPSGLKGRDVVETKSGEFIVNIRKLKAYEVISAQNSPREKEAKITLISNTKKMRLWAIQTLPACRSFTP